MSAGEADVRPAELEDFMAGLRELRQRAGSPSFRQMATKSGAVSHATLHLTVTGYRLQPWETVREFVRVCDGDEQDWHARWQRTHAALSGDQQAIAEPPVAEQVSTRAWRSPRLLVPAVVVVVAGLVFGAVMAFGDSGDTGGTPNRPQAAAGSDEPAYPGDASVFVRDVTIPDKTKVKPGAQFVKIWEIQNAGTVQWRDRYLQRTDPHSDPDDCRTPPRIPVNDTAPKQKVQITVTVNAPQRPAHCKIYWKMVDGNNRQLFPSRRPIYFEVYVRP